MIKGFVIPYRKGSKSVRALKNELGLKSIKLEGSRYVSRGNHKLINWGCNDSVLLDRCRHPVPNILNGGVDVDGVLCVSHATNKKDFFEILSRSNVDYLPAHTTDGSNLQSLDATTIVARSLLRGSGGEGITIFNYGEDDVPPYAPLYVEYIKKEEEYRYHVFQGRVIDVQKKLRSRDVPDEEVNWQVRNHSNGFIFARDGVNIDNRARDIALDVCSKLHIDFGAVDLIYNRKKDRFYALEVNTAPGLTGTTLTNYSNAIRGWLNGH